MAVASVGYFLVLLDVTIVNVALAKIGASLGGSRSELQWVVDAYALVLAATMLGAGDLADRLGSRRLFLGGLALFGVASSVCALSPSAAVVIAARAVQGLGAAAILPSSLAIVNQLFPDSAERPRAIGIWAGLGGSALVLGPILGGALVGPLGWRAIFWANVPLVVGSLTGGLALLPEGPAAAPPVLICSARRLAPRPGGTRLRPDRGRPRRLRFGRDAGWRRDCAGGAGRVPRVRLRLRRTPVRSRHR